MQKRKIGSQTGKPVLAHRENRFVDGYIAARGSRLISPYKKLSFYQLFEKIIRRKCLPLSTFIYPILPFRLYCTGRRDDNDCRPQPTPAERGTHPTALKACFIHSLSCGIVASRPAVERL